MFMSFDGIDSSDLIFGYTKEDNKIIVTYFSGNIEYFDLKKEKIILQIQRDQMEAFLNSLDCEYIYDDYTDAFDNYKRIIKSLGFSTTGLSLIGLGIGSLISKNPSNFELLILSILTIGDIGATISYLINNGYIKQDLRGIEKYKIFMENEDFFNEYNISDNGIPLINANTVDFFKPKQLKRVIKYGTKFDEKK